MGAFCMAAANAHSFLNKQSEPEWLRSIIAAFATRSRVVALSLEAREVDTPL
jgi:hypothetical protein